MYFLYSLPIKQLLRRKVRSAVALLMIFMGTLLCVFSLGMSIGSHKQFIESAVNNFSGHLQILHPGYLDKPSLYKTVPATSDDITLFKKEKTFQEVSPRLELGGLIYHEKRSAAVGIIGVSPNRESKVSTLSQSIKEGDWLPELSEDYETIPAIIGKPLKNRLKASIGSEIILIGQAADGSIVAEKLTVVGVFSSGQLEADSRVIYIPIQAAQEAFVLEGKAHRLVIKADSLEKAERFYEVHTWKHENTILADWKKIMPELATAIQSDKISNFIFCYIILAVVCLGVFNTLTMGYFERTKEFGVMLALGTPRTKIFQTCVLEAVWLSFPAAILGASVAAFLNENITIPLPEATDMQGFVMESIQPANSVDGSVIFPLTIVIVSVLSSLYPSYWVTRLQPTRAMKG